MILAVEPVYKVLPVWLRNEITREQLSELFEVRLRIGQGTELVGMQGSRWLNRKITEEDLRFCINVASKYSPWTSVSFYQGFITIEGGHRIGISSCWTTDESGRCCMQRINSLCIRISKDFSGVSGDLCYQHGSLLIIGGPGSGKTTLLRDLIRKISTHRGGSICVVDERKEIFPLSGDKICFPTGMRTDVISGCPKVKGIEMAIRCMGPKVIAIDEITAAKDCDAIMEAGWCGVDILATAHASGMSDLRNRPVYKPILQCGMFKSVVVMKDDKSWYLERM